MIANECTRSTYMSCTPVSGATSIVANTIIDQMTDKGDGTYSYLYSLSVPGKVTISVVVAVRQGVAGEYFDNTSLTPPSVQNLTTDLFYYKWGTGNISIDQEDNVSVHFKTQITSFVTDIYNFTLVSDAGNVWNFDGYIVNNNMNPVGKRTYYYNNVALNAFQTYSVLVDFADWGDNAEIELYWETNTVSNQTIPNENLSTPYDAALSPYQITVNCPIGYKVGGAAMNKCVLNCGDGLVYGTEVCDDANFISGDGCSSDCSIIENDWICVNGNTTHQSDCSTCDVGYQPNSTKNSCQISEISNETSISLIIVCAIYTFQTIGTFASMFRSQSSTQSLFRGLNQLQLILLLPLIGAYIPVKVVQFIAGMNIALDIMTYIKIGGSIQRKMQILNYSQTDSYLYLINFKDGSSLFNCLNFGYLILCMIVIHILIVICKLSLSRVDQTRCIVKTVCKLYEAMTFAVYIRIILQYYLFLLIASLSELYLFRLNNKDHQTSKIFAVFIYLFCIVIIVFVFIQIFATKTVASEESSKKRRTCIHWFSGIKESRIYRIYSVLFCLRRQLFCILILLFKDLDMITKISVYGSIQFVYMVLCYCLRPLEKTKEAITDSINELIYFVLCILLTYFNTLDRWNLVICNAYIWIIISNNLISLILEVICCFKCKKRSNANKVKPIFDSRIITAELSQNIQNNNHPKPNERNESNLNEESDIRIADKKQVKRRVYPQHKYPDFSRDLDFSQ